MQADQEAADGRPEPDRCRPGLGPRRHAVERPDVQQTHEAGRETDEHVVAELDRVELVRGLDAEDGVVAEQQSVDGEGDDGRDERRQQCGRLDIVAVEELGAEDRSTEGRPEDGPDAGSHTRGDRDARVVLVEVKGAGQERAEPGADLGRRTLATCRPTRADGERRSDELHDGDPTSDATRTVVEGRDGGIRAVPLGLRREPEDDDARQQAAQRHAQRQRQRAEGIGDGCPALACRARGREPDEEAQEYARREFQSQGEDHRAEATDGTDDRRQYQPLGLIAGAPDPVPGRRQPRVQPRPHPAAVRDARAARHRWEPRRRATIATSCSVVGDTTRGPSATRSR